MRWLQRRPPSPRITAQSRSFLQGGLCEKLPLEGNLIPSYFENTNDTNLDDVCCALPPAVVSQWDTPPQPPPRPSLGPDRIALGYITITDWTDVFQAINEEESLGWRRCSTAQAAAPQNQHSDHLDPLNQAADDFLSALEYQLAEAHHHSDVQCNKSKQIVVLGTKTSTLDILTEDESEAMVPPPNLTISSTQERDISGRSHSPRHTPVSTEQKLAGLEDVLSSAIQSINTSSKPLEKKQRQFPLTIPKPSFIFITKKLQNRSNPEKRSLGGTAESEEPLKPAIKQLRFSTDIYSSKRPAKKKGHSGHNDAENIIKSSFTGTLSAEISPKSSAYPGNSIIITPLAEPTDQPTEPTSFSAKTPKAKSSKPPKQSIKSTMRVPLIPLVPLPPAAILDPPPIPGQPYEHTRLPDDADPLTKLRRRRLTKPKNCVQRSIRQARRLALRKSILQFMLGRQLAGPVAANLSFLAGRKSDMDECPAPGLWGMAESVLRERTILTRQKLE